MISLTTSPGTVSLSRNPVYVRLTSSSYSALDNYRAVLRIEVEASYLSTTYTQVAELETVPNSEGICTFEISKILHNQLERSTTFQVPDLENQQPYTSDTLRRYRLKYFERYGTPQADQSSTTSSAFSVILGGVDAHYYGLYDFFSNIDETHSILGYLPTGQSVARDQGVFLNWINHTGSDQNPYISVTQFDVDGGVIGSATQYGDVPDVGYDPPLTKPWQIAVFPISPDRLELDEDCVKYVVGVHVGTYGLTSATSETMTYYISNEYQGDGVDLIWFSAFRLPCVLRCTGVKRTRMDIDRQISDQVLAWGGDPLVNTTVQHARAFNYIYDYKSGSLTPETLDAYSELLIENMLLEHASDGNYYRLLLTGNAFDVYQQRRSPNYLEFSATRALAPGSYMRLRPLSGAAESGNLWEQNDNGTWEMNTGTGYWELNF